MKTSKIYYTWCLMKARCNNPKTTSYKYYGARGIKVCKRWEKFSNFFKDMHKSFEDHIKKHGAKNTSIDRINPRRDYKPSNCRWATTKQQARSRTDNRILTVDGVSKTVAEWTEQLGFKRDRINDRLSKGWTPERAVKTPIRNVIRYKGESSEAASARLGGGQSMVASRILKLGWSLERAFTEPKLTIKSK